MSFLPLEVSLWKQKPRAVGCGRCSGAEPDLLEEQTPRYKQAPRRTQLIRSCYRREESSETSFNFWYKKVDLSPPSASLQQRPPLSDVYVLICWLLTGAEREKSLLSWYERNSTEGREKPESLVSAEFSEFTNTHNLDVCPLLYVYMCFYGTQSLLYGFNESSDLLLEILKPHTDIRCWRSYLWQESVCWGVDALDQWEDRKIKCWPSQCWYAHCFFDLIGQIKPGSRGPTLSNNEDILDKFTAQL